MIFWKSPEVANEELRLQELKDLLNKGVISVAEYLDAVNRLKRTGEGAASQSPGVLGTVQLLLILALVGAGLYAVRLLRQ